MRHLLALTSTILLACGCSAAAVPTSKAQPQPPQATPSHVNYPPQHIKIPAIGVDTDVETVASDKSGAMAAPLNVNNVGWWPGVTPGDPGDAVMDGHKDWIGGVHKVFWSLNKLKPGDEIIVADLAGQEQHWQVVASSCPAGIVGCIASGPAGISVPYKTDPATLGMFTTTGTPTLTLYTCSGTWDKIYSDRLVVSAELH
jgi:sortase (surface protein transpeptidase)